eukprot:TRINITY_DN11844_c0_g1_i1.p1 TRINITY_DN11844_c0_g1~~TRINITY_DN11844_c0_g1_i1.p1  ORF type:complete len:129 (-),score=14.49 TRINITY_DN11844_c0_g1_i1:199-585(-)
MAKVVIKNGVICKVDDTSSATVADESRNNTGGGTSFMPSFCAGIPPEITIFNFSMPTFVYILSFVFLLLFGIKSALIFLVFSVVIRVMQRRMHNNNPALNPLDNLESQTNPSGNIRSFNDLPKSQPKK